LCMQDGRTGPQCCVEKEAREPLQKEVVSAISNTIPATIEPSSTGLHHHMDSHIGSACTFL
jgi:hypothetical protein